MNKRVLVAYFSCSGVTKSVASKLAKALAADLYAIEPETPYTAADLNWSNDRSRSSVEMRDPASRPPIKGKVDVSDCDTILLGFPIWWYVAPTIVNTFLESADFSGKTIVLFATSGGSGFGKTVERLKASVPSSTVIKEGGLLNGRPSESEVASWLKRMGLSE